MLWLQFIIITILAGFFLSHYQNNTPLINSEGLVDGLRMNIRAVIIILSFACLSVEMRNPVIVSLLKRRYMRNLYISLELAFQALPSIISEMSSPVKFLKNPMNSLSELINQAENWLERFNTSLSTSKKIIIISGGKASGKTTFLKELSDLCKNKKIDVKGILSIGYWKENKRISFDLLNIEDEKLLKLCDLDSFSTIKFGKFFFDLNTIKTGNQIIKNALDASLIIIDEIGLWETEDGGWAEGLRFLLNNKFNYLVISVRDEFTDKICSYFNLNESNIYNINEIKPEQLFKLIF